ncbi:MAG: serine/threonine protein kinase, partial [Candidatus Obscuribacterales bacterium]|nr:serine/threonine protein kinase [Candidatus Obscuribacterales bacterium]
GLEEPVESVEGSTVVNEQAEVEDKVETEDQEDSAEDLDIIEDHEENLDENVAVNPDSQSPSFENQSPFSADTFSHPREEGSQDLTPVSLGKTDSEILFSVDDVQSGDEPISVTGISAFQLLLPKKATPAPAAETTQLQPVKDEIIRLDRLLNKVVLDKYSMRRLLANDDVSVLYMGKSVDMIGHVAIKIARFGKPEDAKKFIDEIQARASLSHANTVRLVDVAHQDSGLAYIVYEYPESITLSELIESVERVEKEEDIAGVLMQICDALTFFHEHQIYHGSLNASKVLLLESKGKIVVKLLDFGSPVIHKEFCNFIGGGRTVSSPAYLSPELADGFDPCPRSDMYSLGVLAYQLITGKLPYAFESVEEVIAAHRDSETMPEAITKMRPDLINNQQLSQIVYEAMETDPDWRFEHVREFRAGVEGWINSVRELKAAIQAQSSTHAEEAQGGDAGIDLCQYDQFQFMTAELSAKDLKTSILNLVALKQKTMEQEQTVVIQLTDKFKIGGRRQSPRRTLFTVIGIVVGIVGISALSYFLAADHQDEIKSVWMKASRQLSGIFKKSGSHSDPAAGEDVMEIVDQPPAPGLGDGKKKPSASSTGFSEPAVPRHVGRRTVRKFRYEESPLYRDYIPKSQGTEPITIK